MDTLRAFGGSMQLALRYVIASQSRQKAGLCVGISMVALVVAFSAVLQATVVQAPLIFLKLAEDSVGSADLVRGVLHHSRVPHSLAVQCSRWCEVGARRGERETRHTGPSSSATGSGKVQRRDSVSACPRQCCCSPVK